MKGRYIKMNLYQKGKFLSLLLRHKPEKLNLKMNKYGWVKVEDLINSGQFTLEILEKIVQENNKGRFAFDNKKEKIRALQGHSIKVDLRLKDSVPPNILFHGTAKKYVASILEQGLDKRNRQYVHLSDNEKTAMAVGLRRDKCPAILIISAKEMYDDGYEFYLSENNIWLTDYVPSKYIFEKIT
jgi:putative RNA 2'-phosphotransferase